MLGGRSGRVILLGDGTEIHPDAGDNDTDMFDQSDEDEEKDLASQVKKGQASAEKEGRNQREETPGPGSDVPEHPASPVQPTKAGNGTGPGATPEEPKMMAPTDSIPIEAQKAHLEKS